MKMQELRTFAKASLVNHQKKAWFMAFSYPAVWLIMKLIPDVIAGGLLFQKELLPTEIFFSQDNFWTAFVILWNLLSFCILTPMLCRVCEWFSLRLGLARTEHNFSRGKQYWKSLWFFLKIEIVRFAMLSPFMFCVWLAGKFFAISAQAEDAGIWLFLMIQCLIFAFWAGVFYLRFCVDLCVVPFLFLENPDSSALKSVLLSGNILHGHRKKLVLILFAGWLLPRTVTMLILYLQIRIREYLQEKNIRLTFS